MTLNDKILCSALQLIGVAAILFSLWNGSFLMNEFWKYDPFYGSQFVGALISTLTASLGLFSFIMGWKKYDQRGQKQA
jgi:hypothetical protein